MKFRLQGSLDPVYHRNSGNESFSYAIIFQIAIRFSSPVRSLPHMHLVQAILLPALQVSDKSETVSLVEVSQGRAARVGVETEERYLTFEAAGFGVIDHERGKLSAGEGAADAELVDIAGFVRP